jgi:hypothetical protein
MTTSNLRDRYELLERLGGGSESKTHLARDLVSGKKCVVKELSVRDVLRGSASAVSYDPEDFTKLIELFEREAYVLQHLEHPGIPGFIEQFSVESDDDTRLYIVQEHVEGKTLQAHVDGGRHFTESEAIDVCRRTAEILEYLHYHSPPLIHRDIKPSNIILDDAGNVHVVDFGSVRNLAGSGELDGRTVVGTYGYMPIEQYEARALPQSDLYALGMTLVFLLSHRSPTTIPRRGMTLEFRDYVSVSRGFEAVIGRMIEAAPDDRHASAAELLSELERLESGTLALPIGAGRGGTWRLVAAAVALIVGVGVGGVWFAADPPVVPQASGSSVTQPTGRPLAGPPAVHVVNGLLSIDIYRDFRYVATGWPMGRSVTQSSLSPLRSEPVAALRLPEELSDAGVTTRFGVVPLGNSEDAFTDFALAERGGTWFVYIDKNNNEDLSDDGAPQFNEGSGVIWAADLAVEVDIVTSAGDLITRPYEMWIWFNEASNGQLRGRFYTRHHYAGVVDLGGESYAATVFEFRNHDGLYRESGVCIDLDKDGECQEERELFRDGDGFSQGGARVTVRLEHP